MAHYQMYWLLMIIGLCTPDGNSAMPLQNQSAEWPKQIPDINEGVADVNVIEGDILLKDGQRALIPSEAHRWCGARVPYVFVSQYDDEDYPLFQHVFNDFQAIGIRFVPRTNERDYVYIVNTPDVCLSYVGVQGGGQELTLGPSCFTASDYSAIHHEFMHALGFRHEHNRPDRDSYVTFNMDNVKPAYRYAFDKAPDYLVQGTAYDYYSVMHYPAVSFAIDPRFPTVIPNYPGYEDIIGTGTGLSATDIYELKTAYSPASQAQWADRCQHQQDGTRTSWSSL